MSPSKELTNTLLDLEVTPIRIISPVKDEEEKCQTPRNDREKLESGSPVCPPAPRKPRPVIRCKRRLLELELLVVGAKEMDRLFRKRDQTVSAPSTPRLRVKKPKVSSSA